MKNLTVQKDKILVEAIIEKPEKKTGSLFVEPEAADTSGRILGIGHEYDGPLKVGMKVYYGNKRQQLRIRSKTVEVMDPDNIIAVIDENP